MRRKHRVPISLHLPWICLFFLVSCQGLNRIRGQSVDPTQTAVSGILPTVAPPPRLIPTLAAPSLPTMPPTPEPVIIIASPIPANTQPAATSQPASQHFSNLRFSTAPDQPPKDTFSPGTEEIFAIWEYAGLAPTDRIRRIWFRDDQIWLVREEDWDFDRYGVQGSVLDISVFDNEGSGLPPAAYRLQLYINDALEQEASFSISRP